jgi:hypothetical protein
MEVEVVEEGEKEGEKEKKGEGEIGSIVVCHMRLVSVRGS